MADEIVASNTTVIVAWMLCVSFYFPQYAVRSAPGVMIPAPTAAFGLSTSGVSAEMPIFPGLLKMAADSVLLGLGSIVLAESVVSAAEGPARSAERV